MLKACSYCGRIHDSKDMCTQKEQKIRERQSQRTNRNKKVYDFHRSHKWKQKSMDVRERDEFCCQVCIRGMYSPERQFETENISVHHIVPIAEEWDRRMDDENLITLCSKHHEMAERGEIKRKKLLSIAAEQERKRDCPVCG